jgi:alpha-L-arabinofuranosidase
MNRWTKWYDQQPQHIKNWIDQPRAIWYDSDMWRAGLFGCAVGIIIGLALGV